MLSAALAVAASLAAGPARAEPAGGRVPAANPLVDTRALERATPAQLQSAFLHCDQLASTSLLDFGTAAECGAVYEAFKARVFGGDFQRLLDWWARQPRTSGALAVRPNDRR